MPSTFTGRSGTPAGESHQLDGAVDREIDRRQAGVRRVVHQKSPAVNAIDREKRRLDDARTGSSGVVPKP
jgi:hypothetical protein